MITILLNLLFPRGCVACGEKLFQPSQVICNSCNLNLPRIPYFPCKENGIAATFYGRIEIEKATCFVSFFQESRVQKMMHELKYKGNKNIGLFLGELMGVELAESGFFENIDLLIPLPIHAKKVKSRGYNQADLLVRGISKSTGLPYVTDAVKKNIHTPSQTTQSRYGRWLNVMGSFSVENDLQLKNKHILLVDDILTTGATLEACGTELLKIQGVKLSILTFAGTY